MTSSILITGGAGFIGGHLTHLALAAGHRVRILDNLSDQVHGRGATFHPPPGVEFLLGDVTNRADLKRAVEGVDTIVHLAAETGTGQSMYEVDRYYRVNVQGSALLFDLLANSEHQVRNVVLTSSRSVYGEGAYICRKCDSAGVRRFPGCRSPDQLAAKRWSPMCPACGGSVEVTATRENDRLCPASIYAATKLAQEELVRVACTTLNIAHTILRLQNVYGEGQSLNNPYTGILSIFSTRIRLGLPLPIFEDGEESRDFVHVEDVAEAVLRCISQPVRNGTTFNVGMGQPVSIMSVARLLCSALGSEIDPHVTGQYRIGDIRHNFADLTHLKQVLGFRPQIDLETGINRFSAWVSQQTIPQDLLDKANAELKARKLMA
jgi:dTDP-L-rhamnose 4-epimerase